MVISHGFWQRHFGGDPSLVGRAVRVKLSAEVPPLMLAVVGIMPAGFDYPRGADVYLPAGPLLRGFAGTGPGQPENTLKWLKVFYAVGTPEARRRRRTRDAGADAGLAQPRPRGWPGGAAVRSCCSRSATT